MPTHKDLPPYGQRVLQGPRERHRPMFMRPWSGTDWAHVIASIVLAVLVFGRDGDVEKMFFAGSGLFVLFFFLRNGWRTESDKIAFQARKRTEDVQRWRQR